MEILTSIHASLSAAPPLGTASTTRPALHTMSNSPSPPSFHFARLFTTRAFSRQKTA